MTHIIEISFKKRFPDHEPHWEMTIAIGVLHLRLNLDESQIVWLLECIFNNGTIPLRAEMTNAPLRLTQDKRKTHFQLDLDKLTTRKIDG